MRFANHVTGGFVFTGTMCSLFDINILSSPILLTTCIVGSILPDIDHTRSLIGKVFYPLSRWISRRWGHRTITHSLLFLIFTIATTRFIEEFLNVPHLSIVSTFSIISHLILDMITVQGIPLFYPFFKNPCVIPANPAYRLRSDNLKAEGVVLFAFACLSWTITPLFEDGFWRTYNTSFNDIVHLNRENQKSKNNIQCYVRWWEGDVLRDTEGIVVASDNNEIVIWDRFRVVHQIHPNENVIIDSLHYVVSNQTKKLKWVNETFTSAEQLDDRLTNSYLGDISISSNFKLNIFGKDGYDFKFKRKCGIPNSKLASDSALKLRESQVDVLRKRFEKTRKHIKTFEMHSERISREIELSHEPYKLDSLGREYIRVVEKLEILKKKFDDLQEAKNAIVDVGPIEIKLAGFMIL